MSKITGFQKHRAIDRSDPGFTLNGHYLRWVSGKVSENNPGRPWYVLRKSDLPLELQKHVEAINPGAFTHGDTIRRGDLVLAFSPKDVADDYRKDIRRAAEDQEMRVRRAPQVIDKHGRNRASVEINEEEDVTEKMIEKFKKERE